MKIKILILLLGLFLVGFISSELVSRRNKDNRKLLLHRHISSLRAYEEGYALRHGHYLLLNDSCKAPNDAGWSVLGLPKPEKEHGCLRVESLETGALGQATAPTMRIVGELQKDNLRGVEKYDDKSPTWSEISPP